MPSPQAPSVVRAEKIGRRAGFLLLGLLVSAFTAVCAIQIIHQAWFSPAESQVDDCRAGLRELVQALDRARNRVTGLRVTSESQALATFREALDPEWRQRGAVAKACRSDPTTAKAVKQIEQLRYAEEHAVRYEAQNLMRHRSRVKKTLASLGLDAPQEHLTSPDTNAP